jgi:hypothetical protein
MANNKLTKTDSRFLYETASILTPSDWTAVSEGYTWTGGVMLRVTADEAQYGTVAYVMQKTNTSGDYEDEVTVSLNVPDGHGLSRTDYFSSTIYSPGGGNPDYTTILQDDTFAIQSTLDREAYENQLEQERDMGMIFDYVGTKYRGTITSRTDSKEFDTGGFAEGFEAVITTSRKQWDDAGTIPTLGVSVKVGGVKYRIESIVKNSPHYQINLSKKRGS